MLISPMLLHTAIEPFNDENWIFEIKYNGVRLLLDTDGHNQTLYTRHGTILNGRLAELNNLELPNCLLDGELVCFNNKGLEDFEGVMSRVNSKSIRSINKGVVNLPITYVVFDVLRFKGKKIMKYELIDRKEILNELFEDSEVLRKSISIQCDGKHLFSEVEKIGLEGIVAKKIHSKYQPDTRSNNWLKIINWRYYECFIAGYKKNGTGFLITFADSNKSAGLLEFGMNPMQKQAFYGVVAGIKTGENNQYVFIEPVIKCKIKGRGVLKSGCVMTPVFVDFIL